MEKKRSTEKKQGKEKVKSILKRKHKKLLPKQKGETPKKQQWLEKVKDYTLKASINWFFSQIENYIPYLKKTIDFLGEIFEKMADLL